MLVVRDRALISKSSLTIVRIVKIIDYMESTAEPVSAIIAFRLAETIKIYVD